MDRILKGKKMVIREWLGEMNLLVRLRTCLVEDKCKGVFRKVRKFDFCVYEGSYTVYRTDSKHSLLIYLDMNGLKISKMVQDCGLKTVLRVYELTGK